MILNQVPWRLGMKLTTPFKLVHNAKPDSKTWLELLYIGYFNQHIEKTERRSKIQAHTLDVIAVGTYDKSNPIIFYNPITSSYYFPPASDSINQDSPSLTSPISYDLMAALPVVYFKTRQTQFMSPYHQVPEYQFSIKIC